MNSSVRGTYCGSGVPASASWTSYGRSSPCATNSRSRLEASRAITFNASCTTRSRMPERFARAPRAPATASGVAASRCRSGDDGGLAAVALQEPPAAVGAHVLDQGHERLALLGERVLDSRGYFGIGAALDDAVLLERPKA